MRTSSRKNIFHITVIFIIIITMLWGICIRKLEKSFYSVLENEVKQITNSAIHESIEMISGKINYNEIVDITKNSSGDIIALSANGINISKLKTELTSSFQKNISGKFPGYVSISVGKLFKHPILHSFGPELKFKISPQSFVKTDLSDEFYSSGINQLRHVIYLDIIAEFTITSSLTNKTYTHEDKILIADTVLLGKVPEYYGGNGIFTTNN